MKTDLFQSCGHCWVFQICWHKECSTLAASSFRIWNSSPGILWPPLDPFIMMLPKAIWLHIPGCLALSKWLNYHDYLGCEDLFCTVCVFLPPLLNIFCFCWSLPFLSFIEAIFAWNVLLVSLIFLKNTLVFPILLFSSNSLHGSLRKAFLSLLAVLWNSAFTWVYLSFSPLLFTSLLFTAICKASSDSHFAFLHFFFLGMVLTPVSCTILC